MVSKKSTRQIVLEAARQTLLSRGFSGFTVQAVADAVGVTKQAVLYHFPSKHELLFEAALEPIAAEADAVVAAAEAASTPGRAVADVVAATVAHHVDRLTWFRIGYMYMQLISSDEVREHPELLERVHPVTNRMYAAIEARVRELPGFAQGPRARQVAVAAHLAALGVAMMAGLAEAIDDPLKHGVHDLADLLGELIATGAETIGSG